MRKYVFGVPASMVRTATRVFIDNGTCRRRATKPEVLALLESGQWRAYFVGDALVVERRRELGVSI